MITLVKVMRYINTKTAANISGYSQRQIQYRIKEGILPFKSIGGYPRVWLYDLIAYMEFQEVFYSLDGAQQERVREIANECT